MPLYDCMLLLKPHLKKEQLLDLVGRVGKRVQMKNGVLTDIKSFGKVQLGYGIKKLDGRYFQGQLMQMTMMASPNLNKELHYLNKEDRLLRWLLVKHRNTTFGVNSLNQYEGKGDIGSFPRSTPGDPDDMDLGETDDEEYMVEEEQTQEEQAQTDQNGTSVEQSLPSLSG